LCRLSEHFPENGSNIAWRRIDDLQDFGHRPCWSCASRNSAFSRRIISSGVSGSALDAEGKKAIGFLAAAGNATLLCFHVVAVSRGGLFCIVGIAAAWPRGDGSSVPLVVVDAGSPLCSALTILGTCAGRCSAVLGLRNAVELNPAPRGCRPHPLSRRPAQPVDRDETTV
jgi:hypothetical protein